MDHVQSSKYTVNVDLAQCGCDNVLSQQIVKHDFKDDESWNNTWEDLCSDIGNELKDDNWESRYDLFDEKNQSSIKKLNQFVAAFKNVNTSNVDKIVSFFVGVKRLPTTYCISFLFVCFVLFSSCLCVRTSLRVHASLFS